MCVIARATEDHLRQFESEGSREKKSPSAVIKVTGLSLDIRLNTQTSHAPVGLGTELILLMYS